jgi:DNA-binding SARP family transcriptional activator
VQQAAPARWHVALLGGLRLSCTSQELTHLPSRAVTALLARLALDPGRAHPREELMELLWPGVALGVGRNRLRQALSTLKLTISK